MKRLAFLLIFVLSIFAGKVAGQCVDVGSAMSDICQGGTSAVLGGSFGGEATSAVWSDGSIGGTFSNNDGSTPGTTTWTPPAGYSGTATLTLTASGGSCEGVSDSKNIEVNPNPTVDVGAAMGDICQGGTSAQLGGSVGGSATGGTWSTPAGGTFNPGANNLNATWTPPGSYNGTATLTLTTSGGSCGTTSDTKQIVVNPGPTVNVGAAMADICQGSTSAQLGGSVGGSATGGIWSTPAGGTFNPGPNNLNATWAPPGSYSGTATLTLTTSGGTCGSTSDSKQIVVNPLPVPSITGPSMVGRGTTGNIYTTEGGMSSYNWTVSPDGSIAGNGTNTITVTWNTTGNKTVGVSYTNGNNCTAASPTTYNVTVNALPVASNVSILGDPRAGLTLYASYVYSDEEGDNEAASSLYQWYTGTSSGGAGSNPIPSATSRTYKLTDSDTGKYIGFSVRPVALTGATPGNMVTTVIWVGPVVNDPPVASLVNISGLLDVYSGLTGQYIYSDTEGDIESGSIYEWLSSPSLTGSYSSIPGETSITHVIAMSEQGQYFKFVVTPVAGSGSLTGIADTSSGYGPANTKPYADNVTISGSVSVDSILTGSFEYHDINGDLRGTSTYRWLRNGTIQIPGAIDSTYQLTGDDEGFKITFEATPVSSTGYPDTGTPVSVETDDEVIDLNPNKPVASQVCIEGIRETDEPLRGKYLYTYPRKKEGNSAYRWLRNGALIGTEQSYTLTQSDIDSGEDIIFEVTPVSAHKDPKIGIPQQSNPLARIILAAPSYSLADPPVTLVANVGGGVFTGTGISSGIFTPAEAGSAASPHTIEYFLSIVNPETSCSQQASEQIAVLPINAFFEGFNDIYCHDGGKDTIYVANVPDTATSMTFTMTNPAGIITTLGTDTIVIDPGLMRPGDKTDTLFFSYIDGGSLFPIYKPFVIDSVGTNLSMINLDSTYCEGDGGNTVTIVGTYPGGGTADWTGSLITDPTPSSAYLNPSLGAPGSTYPVSYRYISPSGCNSAVLYDTVVINHLPDATFALDPTYNIDAGAVSLVPSQAGGSFSGNGVSGDWLFPDIAGPGEHEISYSITDSNNCYSDLALKTTIRKGLGTFEDLPSVICYRDTTFNVKVVGLPPASDITIVDFINTKNSIVHIPGATDADYNIPAAGAGIDTLIFSYQWEGVDFDISTSVYVDSVGQVVIQNLLPGDEICNNMNPFELFTTHNGGVFTGPVVGGYFDPSKTIGPTSVSYTYTNQNTGCSTSTIVPVTVFPAPDVSFLPVDVCIQSASDSTFFINKTTSADSVKLWSWEFADVAGTGVSQLMEPGYPFKTGGLHIVSLTATTINNCSARKDSTINLGVKPEADFYWMRECYYPNDSIMFFDTTFSTSPIISQRWNIVGNEPFSTRLNSKYPKDTTGYLEVQYIVNTSYENCSDTVTKSIYIRPAVALTVDNPYDQKFEAGKGGWVKAQNTGNSWLFGKPDGDVINTAASGNNAWFTNSALINQKIESSSIVSPCFDFTDIERPMIRIKLRTQFDRNRDGAVLQYMIGDVGKWQPVGTLDDGINWFNSPLIKGEPGGEQIGWTTNNPRDTLWKEAHHILDDLKNSTDVKFRIAYGSDGTAQDNDGIAFDDIWIGERTRNVLLEHFTNTSDLENSDAAAMVNTIALNKTEDVINIQYHTNFPGADPFYDTNPGDASARILFYGLIKTPYTFIDGGTGKDFANISDYNLASIDSNDVTRRSLINPRFDISMNPTVSGSVLTIENGQITALEDINTDNLTLYLAVTEKENRDVVGANGDTIFYNVFRKFIPDAGGQNLKTSWTIGESVPFPEQSWLIENIKNSADIEVIAFIQNNITKQLYQASSDTIQNIIVGIEDLFQGKGGDFALYPNPAVNRFTIAFEEPLTHDVDIRIYDMRGSVIADYKAGSGSTEFTIENPALKEGIYLVRVSLKGIDSGFRKLIISGD